MGRQNKIKQFQGELKQLRKNGKKVEATEEYAVFSAIESIHNEYINPNTDLKTLMWY